jgi:dolichol-phosphate mannosyltransferase
MLYILIPVYNEKDQIQDVLNNLQQNLTSNQIDHEILIVDDGSTDGSADIVRSNLDRINVKIAQHTVNKGVSAAFRTGFDFILPLCRAEDRVLTMEANKNSDPKVIPIMMSRMNQGADLVLASCYAPGGNVIGDPFLRLLLSKGVNWIMKILFPLQGIHTYTSFYRLWSVNLLTQLRQNTNGNYFTQEGFGCMADMLLKTRRIRNIKVQEIPFILVSDIKEAGSKMKVGRTIMGYMKLFISNLFNLTTPSKREQD